MSKNPTRPPLIEYYNGGLFFNLFIKDYPISKDKKGKEYISCSWISICLCIDKQKWFAWKTFSYDCTDYHRFTFCKLSLCMNKEWKTIWL